MATGVEQAGAVALIKGGKEVGNIALPFGLRKPIAEEVVMVEHHVGEAAGFARREMEQRVTEQVVFEGARACSARLSS